MSVDTIGDLEDSELCDDLVDKGVPIELVRAFGAAAEEFSECMPLIAECHGENAPFSIRLDARRNLKEPLLARLRAHGYECEPYEWQDYYVAHDTAVVGYGDTPILPPVEPLSIWPDKPQKNIMLNVSMHMGTALIGPPIPHIRIHPPKRE